MTRFLTFITALLLVINVTAAAGMPPDQMKNIINLTKDNWIAYRDFNGKQLIYFTHLEAWKCGIEQVKYGLNENSLNQEWTLEACDEENQLIVTKDTPYLTFDLNSINVIKVEITFKDGTKSDIVEFEKP